MVLFSTLRFSRCSRAESNTSNDGQHHAWIGELLSEEAWEEVLCDTEEPEVGCERAVGGEPGDVVDVGVGVYHASEARGALLEDVFVAIWDRI